MHGNPSQPSRRLGRVASRIQFLVSEILRREIRDPRIGFITILRVEPTEDLKEAKVFFSVLGSTGDRAKAERGLRSACGFIQREVGRRLETRNTPALRFIFDESFDKVSRIEALIQKASKEDRETKMAKKPPPKKPNKPDSNKPEKPGKKSGGKRGKEEFEDDEAKTPDEEEEEYDEEEEEDFDADFEEEGGGDKAPQKGAEPAAGEGYEDFEDEEDFPEEEEEEEDAFEEDLEEEEDEDEEEEDEDEEEEEYYDDDYEGEEDDEYRR